MLFYFNFEVIKDNKKFLICSRISGCTRLIDLEEGSGTEESDSELLNKTCVQDSTALPIRYSPLVCSHHSGAKDHNPLVLSSNELSFNQSWTHLIYVCC